MTDADITITVDGDGATEVVKSVMSSMGIAPDNVTQGHLRVVVGEGAKTAVEVEASGPHAGELLQDMVGGVDWTDTEAGMVDIELTTGNEDELLTGQDTDDPVEGVGENIGEAWASAIDTAQPDVELPDDGSDGPFDEETAEAMIDEADPAGAIKPGTNPHAALSALYLAAVGDDLTLPAASTELVDAGYTCGMYEESVSGAISKLRRDSDLVTGEKVGRERGGVLYKNDITDAGIAYLQKHGLYKIPG